MNEMLFLFIIIGVAAGIPCGTPNVCQCYLELGIWQCKGANVTGFPLFSKQVKQQILFLNIINMNITTLPSFKTWSRLTWITLAGNQGLECPNVEVPENDVHVDSECASVWYELLSLAILV